MGPQQEAREGESADQHAGGHRPVQAWKFWHAVCSCVVSLLQHLVASSGWLTTPRAPPPKPNRSTLGRLFLVLCDWHRHSCLCLDWVTAFLPNWCGMHVCVSWCQIPAIIHITTFHFFRRGSLTCG